MLYTPFSCSLPIVPLLIRQIVIKLWQTQNGYFQYVFPNSPWKMHRTRFRIYLYLLYPNRTEMSRHRHNVWYAIMEWWNSLAEHSVNGTDEFSSIIMNLTLVQIQLSACTFCFRFAYQWTPCQIFSDILTRNLLEAKREWIPSQIINQEESSIDWPKFIRDHQLRHRTHTKSRWSNLIVQDLAGRIVDVEG